MDPSVASSTTSPSSSPQDIYTLNDGRKVLVSTSAIMEKTNGLGSSIYARQHDYQQSNMSQQSFRAAPRSLGPTAWQDPREMVTWAPVQTPTQTPRQSYLVGGERAAKSEMLENLLNGYAYCLRRSENQYTRLIPADMLPALNEIPSRQSDARGLVVLPPLRVPAPEGAAEMNEPVSTKVPPNEPVSDSLQKHIDRIIATSPVNHKKAKIYCDKWVHEGVCAFTQQGCKYKHEMPFDKATQHALGLFHGFPAWWKKHQSELQRRREAENPLATSPTNDTATKTEPMTNSLGWPERATVKAPRTPTTQVNTDAELASQADVLYPLSLNGPALRCVWGPIQPPQKSSPEPRPSSTSSVVKTWKEGRVSFVEGGRPCVE